MKIFSGIHSLNEARNFVKMKNYTIHDKYDFPNFDVAVVTTQEEFEFNEKVGFVCLPENDTKFIENGEKIIGLGWGKTSKTQS